MTDFLEHFAKRAAVENFRTNRLVMKARKLNEIHPQYAKEGTLVRLGGRVRGSSALAPFSRKSAALWFVRLEEVRGTPNEGLFREFDEIFRTSSRDRFFIEDDKVSVEIDPADARVAASTEDVTKSVVFDDALDAFLRENGVIGNRFMNIDGDHKVLEASLDQGAWITAYGTIESVVSVGQSGYRSGADHHLRMKPLLIMW
jgi:hypothetical protein